MFAVGTAIAARLAALPVLSGWQIMQDIDAGDRHLVPAVLVRAEGAAVPDSKAGAALLQITWAVHLKVQRGATAADDLDAAFEAVTESLHNWRPGEIGNRGWEPLRISGLNHPEYAEEGVAHYALMFNTAARFVGQP